MFKSFEVLKTVWLVLQREQQNWQTLVQLTIF